MNTKPILLMALAFCVFAFSGCSKDSEDKKVGGKSATITFSVSKTFSKAQGDDFFLGAGGGNAYGSYVDWTVDGKTEKGTVVTVSSDYVNGGKTNSVVKSVQSFQTGSVTISSYNIGGSSFTITYKIEAGGKVIDEQTVEIKPGADLFDKTYTL